MGNGPNDDELYDLAPTETRPKPKPVQPLSQGPPPVVSYRAPAEPAKSDPETIKNFYMPLWLLSGGIAVEVIAAFLVQGSLGEALTYVGINLILGTVLMLVGILLAARLRQIDLGQFWTAVFKLAAIAVAPSAAWTIIAPITSFIPLGWIIGWIITFALYFALLGALFDLDESDTWYCICVIFLVRLSVYFLLLALPS